MDDDKHMRQIKECMSEIADLVGQKKTIDQRIASLQNIVKAHANMLSDSDKELALSDLDEAIPPTGFTEAVRFVLRNAGKRGLTPVEIRDALTKSGIPLTQANPMAAIHTVISRLENGGEIRNAIRDKFQGKDDSVYVWIRPRVKLKVVE